MRRVCLLILTLIMQVSAIGLNAQTLSGKQRRLINEAVLGFLDQYGNYSTFSYDNAGISDSYTAGFISLFNDDSFIYNDIIPSNKISDSIRPTDYSELVRRYYASGIGVRLNDILFDTPWMSSGSSYLMDVELSKEIFGFSKTNVYYRDTIPLSLTIGFVFDGSKVKDLKILKISGSPLGRFIKFRVLEMFTLKPIVNARVSLDGKYQYSDYEGIASFTDIKPDRRLALSITYDDYRPIIRSEINIDRFLEENTDGFHRKLKLDYYDPNEVIYSMSPFSFSLTPLVSFAMPGFKTITARDQNDALDFDNYRVRSGLSPRIGLLAGMKIFRYETVNLSLKAGIEQSFISGTFLFDNYHREHPDIDDNDDSYTRMIDLNDHKQRITLSMTEFPILLSVSYNGFTEFDLMGTVGIRFSSLSKSSNTIRSEFSVSGKYPQFDTVYTMNYHDFKTINIKERSTFPSGRKFYGVQFGIAVSREIIPSVRAYLGPTVILYNKEYFANSSVVDVLTPDEKVNNILYTYRSSKMKYISLELGLIYNFNAINLNKIL